MAKFLNTHFESLLKVRAEHSEILELMCVLMLFRQIIRGTAMIMTTVQ